MILLRHGQSEFNLAFSRTHRDPGIKDPKLTELGHDQARTALESLRHERITRIVCSPYTRALQTAGPIAEALSLPVFVNPIVRERYAFTCDIGTPRAELAIAWPQHDFSALDEVWWPPVEETEASIVDRARLFRAEMAALREWDATLVVTHWGFILSMTGKTTANGQWWRCDPHEPGPEFIVWRP